MSEPSFFAIPQSMTVAEIARITGAEPADGVDLNHRISGIAPLDRAGPADISFFDSKRFAASLTSTRAGACFCSPSDRAAVPRSTVALAVAAPQRAFALVAARLYPAAMRPDPVTGMAGISGAAHIDPTAVLEADVTIEVGAVVGAGAEIGAGTLIGAGTVIGREVRIGRSAVIASGVTIVHTLIGNRVIIHPGARLGQDGFGFVPGPSGHAKIPQIGRVIVQDDVEIGANTTIDRGSNRDTVIGEGTKIDNLVQIGHNCVIGRHCLIAGQVGISGSVTLGDFVMIGGAAGLRDHLTIGNGAQIAAAAGVASDIPEGGRWVGVPAQPMSSWLRELKALRRLARKAGDGKDEGGTPDG